MTTRREGEDGLDVLIVTAVQDEWDAVLTVDTGATPGSAWETRVGGVGPEVARRAFMIQGGVLHVAVVQAFGMGLEQAGAVAARLSERHPEIRCLAMCGVCAGRRGEVNLGDVIVADRAWAYDAGKLKGQAHRADMEQYRIHPPEWKQRAERFRPDPRAPWIEDRPRSYEDQGDWIMERLVNGANPLKLTEERAGRCPNWDAVVEQLWKAKLLVDGEVELTDEGLKRIARRLNKQPDGLRDPAPFKVVVGPIASGATVVEDAEIFDRLSDKQGMRKVIGVEMETSAILGEAHRGNIPHAVVMKGVMDYADAFKSDNMKAFAARASAECLIAFLRENLPPHRSRPWYALPGLVASLLGLTLIGRTLAGWDVGARSTPSAATSRALGAGDAGGTASEGSPLDAGGATTFAMRVDLVADRSQPVKCSTSGTVTLSFDRDAPPLTALLTPGCHADFSAVPARYKDQGGKLTLQRACARLSDPDRLYPLASGAPVPVSVHKVPSPGCECEMATGFKNPAVCPACYDNCKYLLPGVSRAMWSLRCCALHGLVIQGALLVGTTLPAYAQSPPRYDPCPPGGTPQDAAEAGKSKAEFAFQSGKHHDYVAAANREKKLADKERILQQADDVLRCHPPTVLDLARSRRDQGKLVEALRTYRRVVNTKQEPEQWRKAVDDAAQEARETEARIPRISLAGPPPSGAGLTIDGREALLNEPNLINPGDHRVEFRAPGYKDLATTQTFAEHSSYQVKPEEALLPPWPWKDDAEGMHDTERRAEEGYCDPAVRIFARVARNNNDPRLLFDQAFCHLQLAHYAVALGYFTRFLRGSADPALDAWRERTERRYLPQIEASAARAVVTLYGPGVELR